MKRGYVAGPCRAESKPTSIGGWLPVKPLEFRWGHLLILKACAGKCRGETVWCCC
jgi:hypothetical protein